MKRCVRWQKVSPPMLKRLVSIWQNYLSCGYIFQRDSLAEQKIKILTSFSLIGAGVVTIFGLFNFISGMKWLGGIEVLLGLLGIANILFLRFSRNISFASGVVLFSVSVVLIFLFITGGVEGASLLWFFIFPLLSLFLAKRNIGILLVFLLLLLFVLVYFLSARLNFPMPYSFNLIGQLIASVSSVTILVVFYQIYFEQNQTLLESYTKESYGVNLQLRNEIHQKEILESRLEEIVKQSQEQNKILERSELAILNILEDLKSEKNEIELKKAKDDAILNSIGEGVVVTDNQGRVIFVNSQVSKHLGYTEKEFIGKRWTIDVPLIVSNNGEIVPLDERVIYIAINTGKRASGQYVYVRKDSTRMPVQITAAPVVMNDIVIGGVVVFRDITKEREIEEMKDDFISLASHQLRTPATGVKAFLSMTLDGYAGPLSETQVDFLNQAYSSNERQLAIISDLLQIARVESGKTSLHKTNVNVAEIVQNCVKEQSETIRSRKQSIEIPGYAEQVYACLDVDKISMVIDNLVSNASKYSLEDGRIVVDISDLGDRLEIRVKDTGVGISKNNIEKLFQKFVRIDNSLSSKVGGSGLGLYLAKKMVDLHHGRISVESVEGQGTTFTVMLPKGM